MDSAVLVRPHVRLSPAAEVAVMAHSQKLRVYETLHSLNQAFEQVLADFRRLEQSSFLRRDFMRHFQTVIEETRCWANFEIVEAMHSREQHDWAGYGIQRRRWDKRFEDPNDVVIKA